MPAAGSDLVAQGGDQFFLGSVAYVRRADGIYDPTIGLAVRDEGSDADDRVVDLLRELSPIASRTSTSDLPTNQ
jgi:hypothetical protein